MNKPKMLLIEDNPNYFYEYKKAYSKDFIVFPNEYHEFNPIIVEGNIDKKLNLLIEFIRNTVIKEDICFLSLDLNLSEFKFDDKKDEASRQTGLDLLNLIYQDKSYAIRTLPILTISVFSESTIEKYHMPQKQVFEYVHKDNIRDTSLETYLENSNIKKRIFREIKIYRSYIISTYLNNFGDSLKKEILWENIYQLEKSDLINQDMKLNREAYAKNDFQKLCESLHESCDKIFTKLESEYYEKDININELIFDAIKNKKDRLLNALESDNVVPFYQPIVDKNNNVIKYEVLARVQESDSFLPFYIFINIAKFYDLLHNITEIIIKKSFIQLNNYLNNEISINLDYEDLSQDRIDLLMDILNRNLQDKTIKKEQITLEILEGAKQDNYIIDSIKKLKKEGYKIALDDFGIQNSNLERLKALLENECLDFIKIDGIFIKNIDNCTISRNLLDAILILGSKINLPIVVEFVANEDIFKTCKIFDNNQQSKVLYQGYYFGQPNHDFSIKK